MGKIKSKSLTFVQKEWPKNEKVFFVQIKKMQFLLIWEIFTLQNYFFASRYFQTVIKNDAISSCCELTL